MSLLRRIGKGKDDNGNDSSRQSSENDSSPTIPDNLAELIRHGSVTPEVAEFLRGCVLARLKMVISGASGSGKTTLLNVLCDFVPDDERIFVLEQDSKLDIEREDVLRIQIDVSNDHDDLHSMEAITEFSPDRLIIDDCQQFALRPPLKFLDMTDYSTILSVNAESPQHAFDQLTQIDAARAKDIPEGDLLQPSLSNFDVMVQVAKFSDNSIKITHICEPTKPRRKGFPLRNIFRFEQTGIEDNKIIGRIIPVGAPYFKDQLEAIGTYISGVGQRGFLDPEMDIPPADYTLGEFLIADYQTETDQWIEAINSFSLKLLNELYRKQSHENVFLSPLSLATGLNVLLNGTRGRTQAELVAALGLTTMSADDIHHASVALRANLHDLGGEGWMTMDNALWANSYLIGRTAQFKPSFVHRMEELHGTEVNLINFQDASAVEAVNAWVSHKTGHRVTELYRKLDPEIPVMGMNSVLFKGLWAEGFADTKQGEFRLIDGRKKQVTMMTGGKRNVLYFGGEGFHLISIPLMERTTFDIVLPFEDRTLADVLPQLTPDNWKHWMTHLQKASIELELPRFEVNCDTDIKESLQLLGVSDLFDQHQADFSAMFDSVEKLFVSEFRQKAMLVVEKRGITAVALSVFTILFGMKTPPPKEPIVVDRPFFCMIRDSKTQSLLFVGAILEPE